MSLECLLPVKEKRFFVNKVDEEGFAQRNFNDTDQATDNLNFLAQQSIERFFLRAFPANIFPGFIFHSNSAFAYKGRFWDGYIGTDTWVKTAEKLTIHSANELHLADKRHRFLLRIIKCNRWFGYVIKNDLLYANRADFLRHYYAWYRLKYGISLILNQIFKRN
jgi:hypothetical protein